MLKVLKTEIVEFFLRDEWKLTELITGNRLDLIKIIYSETNAFLKIDNILDDAASYGLIEYVIYLSEMGASCSMEANVNAAECGHLDVVKWLHFNRSEGSTTYAIDKAAANGHLDVVKWLHFNRSEGCTTDAIDNAAAFGHLEIVKWLHQNRSEGCSTDAIDNAASNGHLDIVKWLHNNRAEGCTTYAIDYAAANGHLDIVKWLHQNRSEGCTTYAIDYAAANGHLDIVKWLHQNRSEGCVLALLGATRHFQLSVVKYLVENNLGVDRIQDAINSPITAYYSSEKHQQMQEIKNYLRSL